MDTDRLAWFNELPGGAAQQVLLECCAAPGWAQQMAAARPYTCAEDAVAQSGAIVTALTITDLATALAGHPRIGERRDARDGPVQAGTSQAGTGQAGDWSRREQSGVDPGDPATMRALADANLEYERRFGHIYLVCASGRTGKELLEVVRDRLRNRPDDEWQVVRTELQKINALRLQRLMASEP